MKELTLQEMKEIELEILKHFHAFCVENNIRYYLSHGTLLGTIRYKGFIPWDDDVDVLVPREDYNKIISLFKDTEQYKLFCFERQPEYRFPYAKLCDITTFKDEPGFDNGAKLGLDMDIFPLDAWDDDLEKAKKEVKALQKANFRLGLTKHCKLPSSGNFVKRTAKSLLMLFCKMRGSKYYMKKIIDISTRFEGKSARYLGDKAWCVYGERDILPAEIFEEQIELEFEGHKFFGPKGYDAYLTSLYGDYLPEPPKEKQKTHHSFKAYKI